MKKPYQITIKDIAREANTSIATVSRIINGSRYDVNSEVKERVEKIISRHNYTPNALGRMFQKSEIREIGVVLPTLQNPFYIQVLSGIEKIARNNGYDVIICDSNHDRKEQQKHIFRLIEKRIKGLMISLVDEDWCDVRGYVDYGGVVVALDQEFNYHNSININIDFFSGAQKAVQYLYQQGHMEIAFLSLPQTKWTRKQCINGFNSACEALGILPAQRSYLFIGEDEPIPEGVYEFECGKVLGRRFLQLPKMPTAIFTVNDIMAFGVIQAFSEANIDVPGQVSVIGMDNILMSPMINPQLTTVNVPSEEVGQIASEKLIERMAAQESFEGFDLKVETSLIVRNSVKYIKV